MISIVNDIRLNAEIHMKKCADTFKININKIHIGRISPNMLDNIKVEYYGVLTPLPQLTNSIVEGFRTLVITVFDKNMVKTIEKAILISDLGLMPISDENIIRITLPSLTEERRHTLIKMVRSESEKIKISIRNIRRIANDKTKNLLKTKVINEDDDYDFQNKIQKLTNFWIKEIDAILIKKESELMKF